VPIHPLHGLYIEMKTRKGKVSPAQRAWQKRLRGMGYAAEVCYGADDAIATIEQYLAGGLPPF
jgi:hypothetical protein